MNKNGQELYSKLLNELLNRAVAPSVDDVTQKFTDINGEVEVTQETYTLVNPKANTSTITISDPRIIKAVRSYKAADGISQMAMNLKAKALGDLRKRQDSLSNMGFKTVGKFAHHVLGISENTANQYARIGQYLLTDEAMPLPCFPQSIQVTKLLEFLKYVVSDDGTVDTQTIESLYARRILVDGMSQQAIRTALDKHFKALPEGKSENADNTESTKSEKPSKSEKKSKNIETTFVDGLEGMDKVQAVNNMLNSVNTYSTLFNRFIDDWKNDPSCDVKAIIDAITLLKNATYSLAGYTENTENTENAETSMGE